MKRPIGISDAAYTANLEAEVERLAKEREEYRQQSIRHTILTGEVVQKLEKAQGEIETLNFHLKDKEYDAAALERLSKGLYERIQNRSRYINLSNVDTALDHIDFLNLQLAEAKAKTAEECAKIVDTFDTAQWSDTQRNVVRIVAHRLRESFSEKRVDELVSEGACYCKHLGPAHLCAFCAAKSHEPE